MTQAIAAVPHSLARRRRLSRRRLTSGLGVVGRYLLLAGLMLWITFPFLWALSCSLRPIDRLFTATPE
jgi:ABC-type glycerol-3-phosphate transport system permease component